MKWISRTMYVVKLGLAALRWFDAAKEDGVITLDEMTAGVTELLEVAGLAHDVRIEIGKD